MAVSQPAQSPIAIIAIFAGMVEASAIASLPLLDDESKRIYVWLLVAFPILLTVLFFVTLNFNSRAFYTPKQISKYANAPYRKGIETYRQEYPEHTPDTLIIESFTAALNQLRHQTPAQAPGRYRIVMSLGFAETS